MNGFGIFVAQANIVTNRVMQFFTMRKPQFSQNLSKTSSLAGQLKSFAQRIFLTFREISI